MHVGITFLDCPAYTDRRGTARCGLPAEVEDRYTISSTEGPQDSVKIRCPRGHWFNGPIEALTWQERPTAAPSTATRTGLEPAWPPGRKQRISELAGQAQAVRHAATKRRTPDVPA